MLPWGAKLALVLPARRGISPVAAPCCSIAVATAAAMAFTPVIMPAIRLIAVTASPADDRMAPIWAAIFSANGNRHRVEFQN